MRYRYLQSNKHDCITCLRWLSKGIWHFPQIIDPGYSQPVQCANLSYQWHYPDVQWYFCLHLDGTRSDRMVQDHLWCPPRRYAITVPIHCSIGLCTVEDTTGRCWFCGLQTEWQTASRYPYRRFRIRWWYLSSGRIIDDVECSLHRIETSAAEIGLTINYNKTKVMHLGQTSAWHVRIANGDPVDSCDKFEYLGVPTSNAETVFRSRLSKAWAAATKLRSIFNSKANDSIKIGLCRSAVESILLYGLECLPLTLTLQDKLDSAYRRILRYALGVHFPVCIPNAELARRTGATALSKPHRQRRLRLVGHALRMANPLPLSILLRFLQPGLRRHRGQARTLILHQNIIDDISAINQSVKSITSASSSYFNRIVATLSTNWAFNIYIYIYIYIKFQFFLRLLFLTLIFKWQFFLIIVFLMVYAWCLF